MVNKIAQETLIFISYFQTFQVVDKKHACMLIKSHERANVPQNLKIWLSLSSVKGSAVSEAVVTVVLCSLLAKDNDIIRTARPSVEAAYHSWCEFSI